MWTSFRSRFLHEHTYTDSTCTAPHRASCRDQSYTKALPDYCRWYTHLYTLIVSANMALTNTECSNIAINDRYQGDLLGLPEEVVENVLVGLQVADICNLRLYK